MLAVHFDWGVWKLYCAHPVGGARYGLSPFEQPKFLIDRSFGRIGVESVDFEQYGGWVDVVSTLGDPTG